MRKCTAKEPKDLDAPHIEWIECGDEAVYMIADRFGRYVNPRCAFHGEAFTARKPIEKETK
jgi:hypothetical protein